MISTIALLKRTCAYISNKSSMYTCIDCSVAFVVCKGDCVYWEAVGASVLHGCSIKPYTFAKSWFNKKIKKGDSIGSIGCLDVTLCCTHSSCQLCTHTCIWELWLQTDNVFNCFSFHTRIGTRVLFSRISLLVALGCAVHTHTHTHTHTHNLSLCFWAAVCTCRLICRVS